MKKPTRDIPIEIQGVLAQDAPPGRYRIVIFDDDDEWGGDSYSHFFTEGIIFGAQRSPFEAYRLFEFVNEDANELYGAGCAHILVGATIVAPWDEAEDFINTDKSVQELINELREEL